MTKNFIITCIIILSTFKLSAQENNTFKIPKQYSIEIGYRNIFSQQLFLNHQPFVNNANQGYGLLFDYAWQLSGFNGKKNASFITVPFGYTMMQAGDPSSFSMALMNYGWTVRHELSHQKSITPFVGYGLLLNNLRYEGLKGSLFGHQTQFEAGVNFNTKTRLKYFAKVQYSYTSYPQPEDPKRSVLNFVDLRAGVRF